MANIQIYVDKDNGDNNNPGTSARPVKTADKAFSLLPASWTGSAEIIFKAAHGSYPISTDAMYLGTPIGPEASSLVIRTDGYPYNRVLEVSARGGTNDEIVFRGSILEDDLMGAVLGRLALDGSVTGPVVSIRGNTGAASPPLRTEDVTIRLQRPISPGAGMGGRFAAERPRVTLEPQQTLTITSHDERSPNLTLIGIKIAPVAGAGLTLLNVRAVCDTCDFYLRAASPPRGRPVSPIIFTVHSDSRIQGGIERHPSREQAGVFIHSNNPLNMIRAVRGGALGGHLTFYNIIVQVSQGGWFIPKSLEAKAAPIYVLTGGAALAEFQTVAGSVVGWGTESNKARIRDVISFSTAGEPDGDGLRLFNGASINSPLGPINMDIYGCNRDGIRLDSGSSGSFGPPGGESGLTTTGEPNGGFGMNVRNASRALVAMDTSLSGEMGEVALDGFDHHDQIPGGWSEVFHSRWHSHSNGGLSLVRLHT